MLLRQEAYEVAIQFRRPLSGLSLYLQTNPTFEKLDDAEALATVAEVVSGRLESSLKFRRKDAFFC